MSCLAITFTPPASGASTARAATPGLTSQAVLDVAVLDHEGRAVDRVVDGNRVRLRVERASSVARPTEVTFQLDGGHEPVARCTLAARTRQCDTAELRTLGWYWSADGRPGGERRLVAVAGSEEATIAIRVTPRPVVLLHGFISSSHTWASYTAPDGFLARVGLKGYAVGDGQADGVMDMGDPAHPRAGTQSLQQNAAALDRYVDGVKRATGAEMVDLVAHSMGGLVSRYYIARLMRERDVAQLVMLGSPHGGSDCANLPVALGFFMPSSLELRPSYQRQIFNRSFGERRGVAFAMLAGNHILESFKAPCSGVPSDVVVALDSAAAIAGRVEQLPVLHTQMTRSEEVFRAFVLPKLQHPARDVAGGAAPPVPAQGTSGQTTQVFAGRVEAGATKELEVNLDDVAVASFALFDPTRSLSLTVRGASGNAITLTPQQNGLIKVDDAASLVHLGYGFDRPRPGPWRLTLQAAPGIAADYALSARVVGGAVLRTEASTLTPIVGEAVTLRATLTHPTRALQGVKLRAVVHAPDGSTRSIDVPGSGASGRVEWRADQPGLHGVDVVATAASDGLAVERTAFLAVDVRPRTR